MIIQQLSYFFIGFVLFSEKYLIYKVPHIYGTNIMLRIFLNFCYFYGIDISSSLGAENVLVLFGVLF